MSAEPEVRAELDPVVRAVPVAVHRGVFPFFLGLPVLFSPSCFGRFSNIGLLAGLLLTSVQDLTDLA